MGKSYRCNVKILSLKTLVMDSHLSLQPLEYLDSGSSDCALPASSAPFSFFHLSAESFFSFICVCVCDWAKFSAPVFLPVRSASCTLLLQIGESVILNQQAGWQREAVLRPVLWIIVLHSCKIYSWTHMADTSPKPPISQTVVGHLLDQWQIIVKITTLDPLQKVSVGTRKVAWAGIKVWLNEQQQSLNPQQSGWIR